MFDVLRISVTRPYRLTVRTDPSQGLNQGSIPCRVTFNSAHEKLYSKRT